jgi:choice-of-anchor A domain-containing protein
MRYRAFVAMLAGLGVGLSCGSAQAAGSAIAGLTELSELNVVVLGDMTGGDDVEGKTFVGGNLTNGATFGGGTSANPGQGFTSSSFATLTVGGNLSGSDNIDNGYNGYTANGVTPSGATVGGNVGTINLNASNADLYVGGSIGLTNGGNGATIMVGGSLGSNPHPNGTTVEQNLGAGFSGPLQTGIANDTATLSANMMALSTGLTNLGPTAGSSFNVANPNDATLTAKNTGLGYAVIDITAAQLESARTLVFDIAKLGDGAYLPTIINVTGGATGTVDVDANNNNAAYGPDLIWNFENAKNIDFQSEFNGSVLARNAMVTSATQLNGSLVAQSFNQGGEVHLGTWEGDADLDSILGSCAPEPAAWALMIAGLGLVGASLRRRSRAYA